MQGPRGPDGAPGEPGPEGTRVNYQNMRNKLVNAYFSIFTLQLLFFLTLVTKKD